eukprot:5321497-Amphidinium_carterae.1
MENWKLDGFLIWRRRVMVTDDFDELADVASDPDAADACLGQETGKGKGKGKGRGRGRGSAKSEGRGGERASKPCFAAGCLIRAKCHGKWCSKHEKASLLQQ